MQSQLFCSCMLHSYWKHNVNTIHSWVSWAESNRNVTATCRFPFVISTGDVNTFKGLLLGGPWPNLDYHVYGELLVSKTALAREIVAQLVAVFCNKHSPISWSVHDTTLHEGRDQQWHVWTRTDSKLVHNTTISCWMQSDSAEGMHKVRHEKSFW